MPTHRDLPLTPTQRSLIEVDLLAGGALDFLTADALDLDPIALHLSTTGRLLVTNAPALVAALTEIANSYDPGSVPPLLADARLRNAATALARLVRSVVQS